MPPKNKSKRKTSQQKAKTSGKPKFTSQSSNTDLATSASNLSFAPDGDATNTQSGFFKLPLELREKIYTLLLDVRHARGPNESFQYATMVRSGKLVLKALSPPYRICTALLRVNKKICAESTDVLYSSNLFIRLHLYNDDIYWTEALLEGTTLGFVSTNPVLVSKLTKQALDVKVIMEGSKQLRFLGVVAAIYLPRFISLLQPMCDTIPRWGKEHDIHLHLRHRYRSGPEAMEKILLEPWRSLHGINNVVIGTDVVSPAYAKDLRSAMMGQRFRPWQWLESLKGFKEMGTADFKKGDFGNAFTHFFNLVEILTTVYAGGLAPQLLSAGWQFDQAINRLRFQCELNIVLCVCKIRERWGPGIEAADRALDLTEEGGVRRTWRRSAPNIPSNDVSWYSDADRAKARFRRGSFMVAVGEYHIATVDFSAARDLSPGDSAIAEALESAKAQDDPSIEPGTMLERLGIGGW